MSDTRRRQQLGRVGARVVRGVQSARRKVGRGHDQMSPNPGPAAHPPFPPCSSHRVQVLHEPVLGDGRVQPACPRRPSPREGVAESPSLRVCRALERHLRPARHFAVLGAGGLVQRVALRRAVLPCQVPGGWKGGEEWGKGVEVRGRPRRALVVRCGCVACATIETQDPLCAAPNVATPSRPQGRRVLCALRARRPPGTSTDRAWGGQRRAGCQPSLNPAQELRDGAAPDTTPSGWTPGKVSPARAGGRPARA
jgi:hypothetical protein